MSSDEIRLAIAGVGNCAAALVQGIQYYADGSTDGLMHESIGDYLVGDILPVCAFDVDSRKTGESLTTAISAAPNCGIEFESDVAFDAPVYRGPQFDGVAEHTQAFDAETRVTVDDSKEPVDVATKLNEHEIDVLINYLPVGSTKAAEHYAEACLDAGVSFVNAVPVFIASDEEWATRFTDAGIPVVGDDIKSQLGATITHRSLVQLFQDRGVSLDQTYQLNIGGNTDFLNMLDQSRLSSKKVSKTEAVNELLEEPLDDSKIHIGPSDYVPWLNDQKSAVIRLEGTKFGGVDVELELKLDVEDSPNSAGSAVDAIRCAKLGMDRDLRGPLSGPAAVTMKHPPEQMSDEDAMDAFEDFTAQDAS
ncbi:inositol-3-phosphate synthase [Halorussus pelagicus]|uniref:inositol-3-phosphate synthase n=1 Tax=Halorussus pelagicus TaxID=2505977 RepID=UPI001FB72903|nr:inositol-3-phosphate synthase [Halorussus pelagicus]